MNLLLVTQVYPDELGHKTLRSSSVCHYWSKEWVKMGHRVVVLYCYPNYHPIFHFAAQIAPQFIAQYTNGTLPYRMKKSISYVTEGVEVIKIPMYKIMPKIRYSKNVLQKILDDCELWLNDIHFVPDLILGHFDNPILEIGGMLKDRFKVPFSFVLHGYANDIKRLYPRSYISIIDKVDIWGYRSLAIKEDFDCLYPVRYKSFICYSGIPSSFLKNVNADISKIKGKVCYVGALIKRKYPEALVNAFHKWIDTGVLSLTYIGEGALKSEILRNAKKYHIERKIQFVGQISREEVYNELVMSEYFVMISRHETFGLVYLEAMACGCIVIASKKEGFDGIIKHGENGFLCTAGDDKELNQLMKFIIDLPEDEKRKIRNNAIYTAKTMTESAVAKEYLNQVLALLKK